jgi:signal transduction histidine kinase
MGGPLLEKDLRGWGLAGLLTGDPHESGLTFRLLLELAERLDCDAVGLRWMDTHLGFPDALMARDEIFGEGTVPVDDLWQAAGGLWQAHQGVAQLAGLPRAPRWPLGRHLAGPLSAGGVAWASIHVHRRAALRDWDDSELAVFRDYCVSLGLVVENRLMQSLLKREVHALRVLTRASERWQEQRDPGLILASALEQALDLTGFSHGLALAEHEASGELRPVAAQGVDRESLERLQAQPLSPYGQDGLLRAIRQQSLSAADVSGHAALSVCFPRPLRSFMVLALRDGAHFEGALLLGDAAAMGHAAARLAQAVGPVLAGQAARTLRSAALFRDLGARTLDLKRASRDLMKAEQRATLVKLAAAVAHQIRNPLSVVAAHVDLMRDALDDDAPQRQTLDLLSKKVAEANATIQQLLELSRPLQLQLKLSPVEPALRSFMRFLEPKARQQGVAIALHPADGLQDAWMDETHLQRCLLDLCLNSLNLLAPGGRVEIRADQAGPERVCISVIDNGPGIKPELQPNLFEPFATGRSGGTGMGLYNVKRICQEMGVVVIAGNLEGCGSRFSLHLRSAAAGPPDGALTEDGHEQS